LTVEEAERLHRGRHLRGPAQLVRAHVGTGRGGQRAAATACASREAARSLLWVTTASAPAMPSMQFAEQSIFDQFFKFCSVFKLSNFHRRTAAKRTRSSQLA
jgi:hypothetical protein